MSHYSHAVDFIFEQHIAVEKIECGVIKSGLLFKGIARMRALFSKSGSDFFDCGDIGRPQPA